MNSKADKIKSTLHKRNKHRKGYDFTTLVKKCPELVPMITKNDYGTDTIDFFDPEAVKMLNRALLLEHYSLEFWDIPDGFLCPPVPGRADYIHHIADLISEPSTPKGSKIRCLDIGTGANCIYPIIGSQEYGWSFVATDIDDIAIQSANSIVSKNLALKNLVKVKQQKNRNCFFQGIIEDGDVFEFSICNPPFHSSAKEAKRANKRKFRNINPKSNKRKNLNFGGQANELWTPGGEEKFIHDMIHESRLFPTSCYWFTSLVSKEEILQSVYKAFKKAKVIEYKTIEMGQGNKKSRIVAWTFLDAKKRNIWKEARW